MKKLTPLALIIIGLVALSVGVIRAQTPVPISGVSAYSCAGDYFSDLYPPSMAVDGNFDDGWICNKSNDEEPEHWIRLDLSGERDICRVVLRPGWYAAIGPDSVEAELLSVSTDAGEFEVNMALPFSARSSLTHTFTSTIRTSFIELRLAPYHDPNHRDPHNNNAEFYKTAINEIVVHECAATPTPTPTDTPTNTPTPTITPTPTNTATPNNANTCTIRSDYEHYDSLVLAVPFREFAGGGDAVNVVTGDVIESFGGVTFDSQGALFDGSTGWMRLPTDPSLERIETLVIRVMRDDGTGFNFPDNEGYNIRHPIGFGIGSGSEKLSLFTYFEYVLLWSNQPGTYDRIVEPSLMTDYWLQYTNQILYLDGSIGTDGTKPVSMSISNGKIGDRGDHSHVGDKWSGYIYEILAYTEPLTPAQFPSANDPAIYNCGGYGFPTATPSPSITPTPQPTITPRQGFSPAEVGSECNVCESAGVVATLPLHPMPTYKPSSTPIPTATPTSPTDPTATPTLGWDEFYRFLTAEPTATPAATWTPWPTTTPFMQHIFTPLPPTATTNWSEWVGLATPTYDLNLFEWGLDDLADEATPDFDADATATAVAADLVEFVDPTPVPGDTPVLRIFNFDTGCIEVTTGDMTEIHCEPDSLITPTPFTITTPTAIPTYDLEDIAKYGTPWFTQSFSDDIEIAEYVSETNTLNTTLISMTQRAEYFIDSIDAFQEVISTANQALMTDTNHIEVIGAAPADWMPVMPQVVKDATYITIRQGQMIWNQGFSQFSYQSWVDFFTLLMVIPISFIKSMYAFAGRLGYFGIFFFWIFLISPFVLTNRFLIWVVGVISWLWNLAYQVVMLFVDVFKLLLILIEALDNIIIIGGLLAALLGICAICAIPGLPPF